MISVEEARSIVLNSEIKLNAVDVPLLNSYNRILAEDIYCPQDIPLFENSLVDGYAVMAEDVKGADKSYPVRLMLQGRDPDPDKSPVKRLNPGFCIPIKTGAPLPLEADSVVRKDDTEKDGESILVFKEVEKGKNIKGKGEDIKKGQLVLKKGNRINSFEIATMALIGNQNVRVNRLPAISIVSAGDELININEKQISGKVRDSSSFLLASFIKELMLEAKVYGVIKNNDKEIKNIVTGALSESDILLINTGMSEENHDIARIALNEMGAKQLFWRIRQKPGMFTSLYSLDDKYIFILPGNNTSLIICYELYVRPFLKKILGYDNFFRPLINAETSFDYKNEYDITSYIRVSIREEKGVHFADSLDKKFSGFLLPPGTIHGIGIIPEGTEMVNAGSKIEVYML